MAHARTLIPTSGSTGPFTVPFPYIDKDHVKVRIAGVPVGFSWVTSSTISLDDAPATDSELELRRETPLSPLNTFQNGPLDATGLNRVVKQALYVAQEKDDTFSLTDAGFDSSVAEAAAAAAGLSAAGALAAQGAAEAAQGEVEDALTSLAGVLAEYVKEDGTVPFSSTVQFPRGGLRPGGGPSFYETPEQAVRTTAGVYGPFDHGAAVPAVLVKAFARCKVADLGYSVGDEVEVPLFFTTNSYGVSCWSSATQVGGSQGHTVLNLWNKTTGAAASPTAASWRIVLRAYWL